MMNEPSFLLQKTSKELNENEQENSKFREEFEEPPPQISQPEKIIEEYIPSEQFQASSHPIEITESFAEANNTLKAWWITLQADRNAHYSERCVLYEKALKNLGGCYKIWYNYLKESIEDVAKLSCLSIRYQNINKLFERALSFLHKMPRIWILYCEFLIKQRLITKTRETFDKALTSLPATQHEKIWAIYHSWALKLDCISTSKSIIKRYLKINPDFKENYLSYLLEKDEFNEAALILKEILDDDGYASNSGKSKYQFLMQLCELISKHPEKIVSFIILFLKYK